VARIRTVLRRQQRNENDRVRLGELELDTRSLLVTCGGSPVDVTKTEARILEALIAAKGRSLSREEILSRAFDSDAQATERTIDAHVKNLRRKLGAGSVRIATTFGFGYRIEVDS
jgi:two-component system response regulator BaeR/two-component system response regulator AdeR